MPEKARQLGWFVGLWISGVLAVGLVAMIIKFWLKA